MEENHTADVIRQLFARSEQQLSVQAPVLFDILHVDLGKTLANGAWNENIGDKTLGGVRLREKKYHFHLGHHNKNSFVGKPKDLAVHVWYVNHIGFL